VEDLRAIIRRAETLMWPHEPGIENDPAAAPLLQQLKRVLDNLSIETYNTPAELGRSLGARVVLVPLKYPRGGWTWFRPNEILIEIATWITPENRQFFIAHEDCHTLLGPPPERHHHLTERVCNWGAGVIMWRINGGTCRV